MRIDLDAPIQLVPCGVPGDVDALSGRAHICEDRMSIAVTECEPFEPGQDCGHCPPGETPRFLYATVAGVRVCASCVEVSGFHSVQVTGVEPINGGEYELEQWLDGPYGACSWRICLPAQIVRRFYWDRHCQDFRWETVFRSVLIWAYLLGDEKRLEINASEREDCAQATFRLFNGVLPHDGSCLEWPTFPNLLVCGTPYLAVGSGSVSIRT